MLFKFLSKGVEAVQNQIMGQLRSVQDEVQSPITSMLNTVMSDAWIGDDAESMANEISTVVMPMVADLIAAIGGINTGITRAIGLINETEQKATSQINDLVGTFSSIF
jgi:hypothetical protein